MSTSLLSLKCFEVVRYCPFLSRTLFRESLSALRKESGVQNSANFSCNFSSLASLFLLVLYDSFGRVYYLIHVVLGNHLVGSTKIKVEGLNFVIRLVLILVHLNVRDYVWVVQRSKLALRVKFMIAFLELFELF